MKVFIAFTSICLGILYFWFIDIEISSISNNQFVIKSNINQGIKLHVQIINQESKLICNNKIIPIDNKQALDYFYHGDVETNILIHSGINICKMENLQQAVGYKIKYSDYAILLIFIGIPIYNIIFNILIHILEIRDND